ncbi:hypothetical protein DYB32_008462 [Aphanomyces invadans]|uniref:Uncharacterized protein n=1 Tax=Aphanomyces invadans TaxID=157072 RepID=A0A418AL29_9STRA|nr:hypothetical protein DYB32_008462 [Aphanomyces invadans]
MRFRPLAAIPLCGSVSSGLHWTSKYSRTVDPTEKSPPIIMDGTAMTPPARMAFYLKLLVPPVLNASSLGLPGDLVPYNVAEDVQTMIRQAKADVTATSWLTTFVAKINKDDTYD